MTNLDKLKDLKELLDSGVIDQDEFDHLKKEIIDEYSAQHETSSKGNDKTADIPASPPKIAVKAQEPTSTNDHSSFQTTDEFWVNFHASLSSPLSAWREYNDYTISQWIDCCHKGDFPSYLNIILDNVPLFKGEYPIVYVSDSGMIATNYRLFFNSEAGLHIVPFKNLKFYGQRTRNEFSIEFEKNGKLVTINPTFWILKEHLDGAINGEKWLGLTENQQSLLNYSYFELKTEFNLDPPKVDFKYSKFSNSDKKIAKRGTHSNNNHPDEMFGMNIFKYISSMYINQPWIFLIIASGIVGSCFWYLICCVIPSLKMEYELNGFESFLTLDGLIFAVVFVLPITISLFASIKMIFHLVTGRQYPGGESAYSAFPLIVLILYLASMSFLFRYTYAIFSI
jgi:hypothetical protein